jgi:hypothetical protein
MKPHIISTMPKEFQTIIKILKEQIPASMAQQGIDCLQEDADQTELAKEIRDESTASALFCHRAGHRRRGGRGNR